jgi:hypothetical protein
VYIDQIGNNNTAIVDQRNASGKSTTIVNEGDANYFNILQQGGGNHSTSVTSTSTNNSNNLNVFNINQSGNAEHKATIILNNISSETNNNTASITQSGNAPKSMTLNLTGSGIGFTGIQDNFTIPDSVSISIICLTPPCTGYSYIKN